MFAKIDYLSFSVPFDKPLNYYWRSDQEQAHIYVDEFLGGCWTPITLGHEWELKGGHNFYKFSHSDKENKFMLQWGNIDPHVHIQIGGKGCDVLREKGILENILQHACSRVSRIDIALDFEDECPPIEFTVNRQKGRIKTEGNILSESGQTSYVGSRKSDRFARVYRYAHPHPRSKFLRVEHECKGHWAKAISAVIVEHGLGAALPHVTKPFGWAHPLMQQSQATCPPPPARNYDKAGFGTVRWLEIQVKPALQRLQREGEMDVRAWIETVLSDLK